MMCVECGGTGTIFGLGGMKVQCPICDGKRIVDLPKKSNLSDAQQHAKALINKVKGLQDDKKKSARG